MLRLLNLCRCGLFKTASRTSKRWRKECVQTIPPIACPHNNIISSVVTLNAGVEARMHLLSSGTTDSRSHTTHLNPLRTCLITHHFNVLGVSRWSIVSSCQANALTIGSAHLLFTPQCVVNGCKGWQGVGSLLCRAHANDPMAARIAHVHTHIDAYRAQRALYVVHTAVCQTGFNCGIDWMHVSMRTSMPHRAYAVVITATECIRYA